MSAPDVTAGRRADRRSLLKRAFDHLERALRPAGDPGPADDAADSAPLDDDLDSTTTRELLIPTGTEERPAARASRQAQDYLERRRRKLSRRLDDGH